MAFYISTSQNRYTGDPAPSSEVVEDVFRALIATSGMPTYGDEGDIAATIDPTYSGEIRNYRVTVELVSSEVRNGN